MWLDTQQLTWEDTYMTETLITPKFRKYRMPNGTYGTLADFAANWQIGQQPKPLFDSENNGWTVQIQNTGFEYRNGIEEVRAYFTFSLLNGDSVTVSRRIDNRIKGWNRGQIPDNATVSLRNPLMSWGFDGAISYGTVRDYANDFVRVVMSHGENSHWVSATVEVDGNICPVVIRAIDARDDNVAFYVAIIVDGCKLIYTTSAVVPVERFIL